MAESRFLDRYQRQEDKLKPRDAKSTMNVILWAYNRTSKKWEVPDISDGKFYVE